MLPAQLTGDLSHPHSAEIWGHPAPDVQGTSLARAGSLREAFLLARRRPHTGHGRRRHLCQHGGNQRAVVEERLRCGCVAVSMTRTHATDSSTEPQNRKTTPNPRPGRKFAHACQRGKLHAARRKRHSSPTSKNARRVHGATSSLSLTRKHACIRETSTR